MLAEAGPVGGGRAFAADGVRGGVELAGGGGLEQDRADPDEVVPAVPLVALGGCGEPVDRRAVRAGREDEAPADGAGAVLEAAGLAIAATACVTAERNGVAAQPAAELWALLLSQPSRPGRGATSQADARKLTEWLPVPLRDLACELLAPGHIIPQEALRFDILTEACSTLAEGDD